MKRQVFVIHGGTAFDTYEEYLEALKTKEVDLARMRLRGWKATLEETLGEEYEVIAPRMPSSENAKYSEWKIWFEKFIPFLSDGVVFVGHSLGGMFLAKYLSEENLPKKIRAVLLVAAPYNTASEHPLADFILVKDLSGLAKQGGEIYLYHSKDDVVVPFSNFERFSRELRGSTNRIFADQGHFNREEFPEIVEDIRNLG
jgi:uncharacterized protein